MTSENGKLMATAAGAAVAGAALAVAAMKLTEKMSTGSGEPPRAPHVSYLRNNEDEFGDSKPSLHRTNSETLLFPHNHEERMRRRIATRFTIEEENNTPRQSVTVRVPATSANVGPGCTSNIEYVELLFVCLYLVVVVVVDLLISQRCCLLLFLDLLLYYRRLSWHCRRLVDGSNGLTCRQV
jgi:hypothetical protein